MSVSRIVGILAATVIVSCMAEQASAQQSLQNSFQGSFGYYRGQVNSYRRPQALSTDRVSPYYRVLAFSGGYINPYQILRFQNDRELNALDNRIDPKRIRIDTLNLSGTYLRPTNLRVPPTATGHPTTFGTFP